MSQLELEKHFYLQINEHHAAAYQDQEAIIPIGFLKTQKWVMKGYVQQTCSLDELRSECTRRGFMTQADEFLFHPSSHATRMMYQVSRHDEANISLEEYLAVSPQFTDFVVSSV